MNRKCKRKKQRVPKGGEAGFTMVELVLVIVLTSILGMFGFQILTNSLLAQRNMQVRKEHSDDAVLVLDRISREVMAEVDDGSVTIGMTLTLPGASAVYSLNGSNLERTSGGVTNIIARNVASFTTSGTNPITVSMSFTGETGNRETKVFIRNLP
jgi:type II secretory pathway pseudopilin PulG